MPRMIEKTKQKKEPTELGSPPADQATFVPPMLARLVRELPQGPAWSFEVKFDGYRIEAIKEGERVRLFSRRGNDFTKRFAAVAKAVVGISAQTAVLDSEVVAVDAAGTVSFQMLQNR